MLFTRALRHGVKLSLNHSNDGQLIRRTFSDRAITGTAFILATVGLSMSLFSMKQMLSAKVSKTSEN
ncbi:hypothetical protein PV325_010626 [Microctonus aethiopoides]|uniref:Uncharacterized protein n=1 Tax=Microctonus aethiopoides TaxID=144406 RepID=A0AA39F1B7_9HYME|nr:hypothetical protein PV325_010626 [Microctonus aethiopoides]KAK0092903.1 hypothetical protein PV326_000366 [Microctonus aethiopoides]KAK0159328.1 hypothetical protein PV328_010218 [Microctonus aethiopoides]